ncbi:type IX secretion system protein PorD [Flavobacterium rhizosphaerae]|uniref:DUF4835 family protein n=1 Tax=Flavobacterium rhizosphaerae TaxID=3163298 RepID=A0ABW8YVD3_9FLAO
MYKLTVIVLFMLGFATQAQELNCTVQVNYSMITDANPQVFKTLENSLNDFVNNTRFTNRNFARNERIECSMVFTVTAYSNNGFNTALQVQSLRPVFNSTYASPIFNFNDKDANFSYNEGQNLTYNPNTFDSNLISLVSFYANMIIAFDADTFELKGGTPYYETALSIATVAQSGGFAGWNQQSGNQSRYFLVNDVLSATYEPFRQALYQYHREALDLMADNQKEAKQKTITAIETLGQLYRVRPNAFLTRIFFDAKSDEITAMFSSGPNVTISKLVETLNRISPLNGTKWSKIH